MLIAQLSDIHVGGGRYREELLRTAIAEINDAQPDLVVVAGGRPELARYRARSFVDQAS